MRQPVCAARSLIDQNDWIKSDVERHRLTAGLTMEVFKEYNLLEKNQKKGWKMMKTSRIWRHVSKNVIDS